MNDKEREKMLQLILSSGDVDMLARIAQAEAGSIARQPGRAKDAYGSVADVVLNRMASGRHGNSVQDVVGQKGQFEPVSRYGGVDKLPQASPETLSVIQQYLKSRSEGGDSAVGKADHFLNPHISGKKALDTWAKDSGSWPAIGEGQNQHRFGSLGNVPDYQVKLEQGAGQLSPTQMASMKPSSPNVPRETPPLAEGGMGGGKGPEANLLQKLASKFNNPATPDPTGLPTTGGKSNPMAGVAGALAASLGSLGQQSAQDDQTMQRLQAANDESARRRLQWALANGWGS